LGFSVTIGMMAFSGPRIQEPIQVTMVLWVGRYDAVETLAVTLPPSP
jgi:hypothetical protein